MVSTYTLHAEETPADLVHPLHLPSLMQEQQPEEADAWQLSLL